MSKAIVFLDELKKRKEEGSLKPKTDEGERKIVDFYDYYKGDFDSGLDEFKRLLEKLNSNFQIGKDLVAQMEKLVISGGDEDLTARMKIFHRKFCEISRMMGLLQD